MDTNIEEHHARWSRLRILPLYFVFLVLLAGVLELAARFFAMRSSNPAIHLIIRDYGHLGDDRPQRFEAAPYVNYRLAPGFDQVLAPGQRTHHNAQGFRAFEDFGPKVPGTLRIVCLGGSTTYGVTVRDDDDTYPERLEDELSLDPVPGWPKVEVFNMGVGGYSSAEIFILLHFYALPLDPDVVLIQCAINDVAPRFYNDFRCDYSHFRTPWNELNVTVLSRLAYRSYFVLWAGWKLGWLEPLTLQSRTQRPLPKAAVALENLKKHGPECFGRNIDAAIALATAAGAQVWLMTQAYLEHPDFVQPDPEARLLEQGYRQGQVEHNEVLRALAAARHVGLADLAEAMPPDRSYFADAIHATPAGNDFKAAYLAQVLRREVKPPRASP